jgi:hypothetical protein
MTVARIKSPSFALAAALASALLAGVTPASSESLPPDGGPSPPDPDLVAGKTYPKWAITGFAGASAADSDLHELFVQPWLADGEYGFAAIAVSREVARFYGAFSIELEVGAGGRFGSGYDAAEAWVAGYLRYDDFPWNDVIRTTVAISTGLNVVSDLPPDEAGDADGESKILHYFSPEITFALPDHTNNELVLRWHHRSGVFGLFDGVHGGSNIVALGLRHRW